MLILGFAFKENSSDTRNTRVIDVYCELKEFGLEVDIYDPLVSKVAVKKEFGVDVLESIKLDNYQAIVEAVKHDCFGSLKPYE